MALIKRAIQFLREHSTEISESSSALTEFLVSHQQEVQPYTQAMGIPFSSIQRNLSTASMTDFFSTLPQREMGGNDQGLRGLLSLLENRHGPDTRRSLSQDARPPPTPAGLASPMRETRATPKQRTTSWSESEEDDDEGLSFTPRRSSQQILAPAKLLEQLAQSPRSVSSPLTKNGSPGSPAKRTRTLTNTSSLSLQAKLLDFLATPFQDKVQQPLTRSTTMLDISSAPEFDQKVSSTGGTTWLPTAIGDIQPASNRLTSSASSTGLFSGSMARYSATQVVVTTSDKAPYEIRAVNDVACLVFGVSRAELRNTSILSMAREDMREELASQLESGNSSVAICGMVIPVVKGNRQESLASVWVKRSLGALIWVAEEVAGDQVEINVNKSNSQIVDTIGGDRNIMFGHHDWASYPQIPKDMLIREPKDAAASDNGLSYSFTCRAGPYDYPCIVNRKGSHYKITSLPHMSGMVTVDSRSLEITDYNAFFVQYLFGHRTDTSLVGRDISYLLPQMTEFIREIRESENNGLSNPGMVYPEHFFRRMASLDKKMTFFSSIGIDGLHQNGACLKIDCQLRVASESQFSFWISFSRHIQEAHEIFSIPSQLPLLSKQERLDDDDSDRSDSSTTSLHDVGTGNSIGDSSAESDIASTRSTTTSIDDEATAATLSAPEITKIREVTEIGAHKRDRKFEDYKVLKKMGEGAYGRVVLARYPDDPACLIVVKSVVKDRILVDTWVRDRKLGTVSSEIKILAALNQTPHANIVGMVDFLEDDECYHIEMEAHGNPGIDLFDLIELNPKMPEEECRSIFRQIVSAVAHLHGLGIVHRDIKDENIILDSQGLLKLIDFGSAAYAKHGPFDVFVGTIDYAAPEVLSGHPYLGKPQDVWALGILLYTIVYKENPFYNVDEILEGELRIPFVMSDDCLDLIKMILNRDVSRRPTIDVIKNHKWLNT